MAVRASNQATVIDLTDAYSIILTNENHTFLGDTSKVKGTQTTTTQVIALCGEKQVSCTIGTITTPTGISAVSDGASPAPTITITATSALTQGGTFDIPVTVDDITIVKTFSYSIAYTGEGGSNGEDAITMVITSTNGFIFKNTAIATTLTAHVYKGGLEVTGDDLTALGTIKWYKDDSTEATATGATLTISAGDVSSKASYTAQLEE